MDNFEVEMSERFQILSLPGGGFMGYHTALMIDHIERQLINKGLEYTDPRFVTIGQKFDLICGTSIGGIVGLAVAFNIPAAIVAKAFHDYGHKIFPPSRFAGVLGFLPTSAQVSLFKKLYKNKSLFSQEPLAEAINHVFAEAGLGSAKEKVVKDCPNNFLIMAHNISSGNPKAFKTGHHPDFTFDPMVSIEDIALATSAVPCVFSPHKIGNELYVDGAMYANSPCVCGIAEAMKVFEQEISDIHILEICPGENPLKLGGVTQAEVQGASWLFGNKKVPAGLVVSQLMTAQQKSAEFIAKYLIGPENYVKVTSQFTSLTSDQVSLVKADETAKRAIEVEAITTFSQKVYRDQKVKDFLM